MKIYIGFSDRKEWSIGSVLIKWYQGTPYSHTYIKIIDIVTNTVKNLHKEYGYTTLLGILLYNHLKIRGVGDDNNETFICSELATEALKVLEIIDIDNSDYVTPKKLYEILTTI